MVHAEEPTACTTIRFDSGGQHPVVVPSHHYWKPVCCTSCAMTRTSCQRGTVPCCPDCSHQRWTCAHCGGRP